eukprot:297162_1
MDILISYYNSNDFDFCNLNHFEVINLSQILHKWFNIAIENREFMKKLFQISDYFSSIYDLLTQALDSCVTLRNIKFMNHLYISSELSLSSSPIFISDGNHCHSISIVASICNVGDITRTVEFGDISSMTSISTLITIIILPIQSSNRTNVRTIKMIAFLTKKINDMFCNIAREFVRKQFHKNSFLNFSDVKTTEFSLMNTCSCHHIHRSVITKLLYTSIRTAIGH